MGVIWLPLAFWTILLGITSLCYLVAPSSSASILSPALKFCAKVWRWFGVIAGRKTFCLFAIGFTAVALRLAMMTVLAPPHPLIQDEFSYLLAADTFASGRLSNPTHPLWHFFECEHVMSVPTYMSKYPPGQALFLASGQLLGSPWLGVLLSFGAMCSSIYWMALAFLPSRFALLAACMHLIHPGITSYWANTYWGGAVAAIGGAIFLGAAGRLARKFSLTATVALTIGFLFLINSRPYEGAATMLPSFVMLFSLVFIQKRLPFAFFRAYTLVPLGILAIAAGLTLNYNYHVTGNAFVFPYTEFLKHYSPLQPLFILPPGPEPIYTSPQLRDAYITVDLNLYKKLQTVSGVFDSLVNERLSSAYLFFLGIVFSPLAGFSLLSLKDRRVRLLWWTVLSVAAALSLEIWWQKHYAASITAAIYVLLLQGLRHLRQLKMNSRRLGLAISRIIVVGFFINFISGLISCGAVEQTLQSENRKFPRAAIEHRLSLQPGKHLIFVHYADGHNPRFEYVYNASNIDKSTVVWARDKGAEQDQKLIDYYGDRTIWLLDADNYPDPRLYSFSDAQKAQLSTHAIDTSWRNE